MTSTPKPLVLLIALLMVSWVPNVMATDSDGDGVNDSADDFPNDPCADTDTDGDGTPDFRDLDSDNDGAPDVLEGANSTLDTDDDWCHDEDLDDNEVSTPQRKARRTEIENWLNDTHHY